MGPPLTPTAEHSKSYVFVGAVGSNHQSRSGVVRNEQLRSTEMMDYQDATDHPDQRVDYPEIVCGFEDIGFSSVGRILAVPSDGTLEDLGAGWDDRSAIFMEHATIPTPILRAPDRSTFVEVSWFWDSPAVRLRTTLQDGSLVETLRRWEVAPQRMQGEATKPVNIDHTMTACHNPLGGRSVSVLAGSTPEQLWQHHQEHVARYSVSRRSFPTDHGDLDAAITQIRAAFEHNRAVMQHSAGLLKPLVYAFASVGFVAIAILLVLSFVVWRRGDAGWPYFVGGCAVALLFSAITKPFVNLITARFYIVPRRFRPWMTSPGRD